MVAILKTVSMMLNVPNMQFFSMLLLISMCASATLCLGDTCIAKFVKKNGLWRLFFKIVFMLLDNHNMQLGNTLLVIPIWHPYKYQFKNYGQKFEICDGNQLLAAIL